MAAVAQESLAEDEILRRADELKKAVNDANTRDKIPAFDRSALDTHARTSARTLVACPRDSPTTSSEP